jgi:hypothetical protein
MENDQPNLNDGSGKESKQERTPSVSRDRVPSVSTPQQERRKSRAISNAVDNKVEEEVVIIDNLPVLTDEELEIMKQHGVTLEQEVSTGFFGVLRKGTYKGKAVAVKIQKRSRDPEDEWKEISLLR